MAVPLAACDTRGNPAFGTLEDGGTPLLDGRAPGVDGMLAEAPLSPDTGGGVDVMDVSAMADAAERSEVADASVVPDVGPDAPAADVAAEAPPADAAPVLRGECPA